jgi:hypothetical protein
MSIRLIPVAVIATLCGPMQQFEQHSATSHA